MSHTASGPQGLAEPMRSRWSPSVFDEDHQISEVEVDALLVAAQWAPSFGNTQPWSFVLLRRGSPGHRSFLPLLSRGNAGWVPRASLVAVGVTRVALDPGTQCEEKPIDATYSCYDLGQAVAHLTLQAHASGLHTHQFAGFDHEAATGALGVPEQHRVVVGVAVGRRGDPARGSERDRQREQRPRARRDLGQLRHDDRWGSG